MIRFAAVVAVVVASASCTSTGREPETAGPSVSVAYAAPRATAHTGERYESQSSASTADGAAWEFADGLRVRITGATRLSSQLGAASRGDIRLNLVRIDFSYTNNGLALHVTEGHQQPIRLLYGEAREEAMPDGGYAGSDARLTLRVPASVASGATVEGASSFVVPVAATEELAVLVVEPVRYTEHLFTDVQLLLRGRA